jgi:LPXTG-motif cell wall-anchored protein
MRVPSGRFTLAAACSAAVVAMPASIAQATSPGAALSIAAGHRRAAHHTAATHHKPSLAVKRLTAEPARPMPSRRHAARGARGARRSRAATGLTGRVTAHAAGDPAVTIADFHFAPATTTIHVGDTITWSNSGPSSHTASAKNGSFNTGILKKGQSASHTFTQAGTFAYVCQIHPFMHGTIIVLAATTSTTSATTSTPAATTPTGTTPTATTAAAQTPAGPTLPNTGFNVLAGLAAGLLLLGVGAGLRRARAR